MHALQNSSRLNRALINNDLKSKNCSKEGNDTLNATFIARDKFACCGARIVMLLRGLDVDVDWGASNDDETACKH